MRLRCARASFRSSGVTSERERLRGGHSEDGEGAGVDGSEEYDEPGVPGSCSTTKAASTERFMLRWQEKIGVRCYVEGERND